MKSKTLLLLALTALARLNLYAQNCTSPPDCIINGTLNTNSGRAYGRMENDGSSGLADAVPGWYVSDPAPNITAGFSGTGIYLTSTMLNTDRIYTCFNFLENETYEVSFYIRSLDPETAGELVVEAAEGLNIIRPSPNDSQVISKSVYYNTSWVKVSFTFTAADSFNQLTIYPSWNGTTTYGFAVDDVDVINTLSPIAITGTKSTISLCDSTNLTLKNVPGGSSVSWSPAAGLNTTSGVMVTATPSATTTYTAVLNGQCEYSFTVTVDDSITNMNPHISCNENIDLEFTITGDAPDSYVWTNPSGGVISTAPSASVSPAGPADAGTYSLTAKYASGCSRTLYTAVDITGCCEIAANFNINGCNPVRLEDITSGGTLSTPISWLWEFDDGYTSTLKNPARVFNILGKQRVCLTTVNVSGTETCCDKVCKEFTACDWTGCVARAAFGASALNATTHSAQFTSYSAGTGTATSYSWNFGDGSPADPSQNPSHAFSHAGTYQVCLTVGYRFGTATPCYDTWCEEIVIP